MKIKCELYALQNAICMNLNTQKKQFVPRGTVAESLTFSDEHQAYRVPILETNLETQKKYMRNIIAVRRGEYFEFEEKLSY